MPAARIFRQTGRQFRKSLGPGYIPDDGSYGHQTFPVLNATLKPGCAENAIVDAIQDLETQYLNK